MGDRPHRFSANGTHPNSCVRCGKQRTHDLHAAASRPPHIQWKHIFADKRHSIYIP